MPNGDSSIEETLGTISLLSDTIPKHDSSKIDYGNTASEGSRTAALDQPPGPERGTIRGARRRGGGAADEERADEERADEPDEGSDEGSDDGPDEGPDDESVGAAAHGRPPLPPQRPRTPRPVKPGSEEAFYLLATYCFDLQRKMEYLFKATRAFALKADPAMARDLLKDERRINANGLTWKQRAMRAEARMLELQREIGREHLRLLREVAQHDRR